VLVSRMLPTCGCEGRYQMGLRRFGDGPVKIAAPRLEQDQNQCNPDSGANQKGFAIIPFTNP